MFDITFKKSCISASGTVPVFICPGRFTHAPNAYCDGVKAVPSIGVLLIATVIKGNLNAQFVLTVSARRA